MLFGEKRLVCGLAAIGLAFLAPKAADAQATFTWSGPSTGGAWATPADWTVTNYTGPTLNAFPRGGDTADLPNAVSDRDIIYTITAAGSPPAGSVNALNFTQTTASVTNELDLQYNLAVSNPLTVSATNGTSEILLDAPSYGTAATELIPQTQLTIGSGGNVTISGYSSVVNSTNEAGAILGNTTINGGTLALNNGQSGGPTLFGVSQTLTLKSGTISFGGGSGTSTDNELVVEGAFSMSGGSVAAHGVGSLDLEAETNTITGGTLNGAPINLYNSTGQSLTSSIALGNVSIAGSSVNSTTITDTAAGPNIGAITFVPGPSAIIPNTGSTLRLGSNLQASGPLTAAATTGSPEVNETVDLNGNTLDLTGSSGNFAPNSAGTASTSWTIEATNGAETNNGAGRVVANGFTLSGPASVSVGGNVTLEARGATANDLGGGGTINPTSTFLYSGTGLATLVSNRTIGYLMVENGTLQIAQSELNMGTIVSVIDGGTLDLDGTSAGTLQLGANGSVDVQDGTLDLTLGTASDRFVNGGGFGSFSFSNLTLSINEGAGFSTSGSYDILSGFADGIGLDDIPTNIAGYDADISNAGVLTFVAAPEPPAWMLLGASLVLGGAGLRRRFGRT